ncbi:MAG TPA: HDOD domain-containing protein [Desulfobulbus sp.]|nr:HDOD domain-containing protein [Desulfobulbus sp.]
MKRKIITVGECVVGTEPELVLETFLGSCAGVTLYDRVAAIGGMGHFLLPHGSSSREQERPCAYVDKGVPCLVKSMQEAGAVLHNMVAVVAGGAHIRSARGSVDFRIGQRNVLAVREIMTQFGIPITQEDTGGHVGRNMRMQVADGTVSIRSSLSKQEVSSSDSSVAPTPLRHRELRQAIDAVKPISKPALEAMRLAGDLDSSFAQIERQVLQDQVLTATVLRLINSAWYSLPNRISRISQALALLGLARFRRLILQSCMHSFLSRKLSAYSIEEGVLFSHAICCGRLAEYISQRSKQGDPEEAYVAGLLHDIGKVVLEQCARNRFQEIMTLVQLGRISFNEAEQKILHTDHGIVGGLLAAEWGLNPELTQVIAHHHHPPPKSVVSPLVPVVHFADYLCNILGAGMSATTMANPLYGQALADLGLDSVTVEEILDELPPISSC